MCSNEDPTQPKINQLKTKNLQKNKILIPENICTLRSALGKGCGLCPPPLCGPPPRVLWTEAALFTVPHPQVPRDQTSVSSLDGYTEAVQKGRNAEWTSHLRSPGGQPVSPRGNPCSARTPLARFLRKVTPSFFSELPSQGSAGTKTALAFIQA